MSLRAGTSEADRATTGTRFSGGIEILKIEYANIYGNGNLIIQGVGKLRPLYLKLFKKFHTASSSRFRLQM